MSEHRRRGFSTVMGVAASLTALLLAAPRPSAALALLTEAGASSDPTAPLVAAVALAAWVLAGWLALTVALVLLSRLSGLFGRAGRAVAACVAPAAVRRAVEVTLGLTVAVGALAPSTAVAAPLAPAPVADSWDLDWPSTTAVPPVPSVAALPSATAVPSVAARPSPTPAPVRATATTPVATPPATAPPAAAPGSRPAAALPPAVVVRSGDSLWSIAERSLLAAGTAPTDGRVAREWPRWWAANREAVGDDPDLLLPGAVLRPPPGSAAPR